MSSTEDKIKKAIATKRGRLPSKWIVWLGKFVWTKLWQIMMSKLAPRDQSGAYVRPSSEFRNFVSTVAESAYQPAAGRYQLYVGLGCPWAHRTLVVRALKGLEEAISVSTVSPSPIEGGWVLDQEENSCRTLAQVYQLAQSGYGGRSTVPVLWDKQTNTIVNNESSEIIAMLNSEFNQLAKQPILDLYPEKLREKIDWWNEKIYHTVNNGVYRCGFAQTQEAYEQACNELFVTLDEIDTTLKSSRYLCGSSLTLADVRLFTTLFRFDVVYYSLFKCNRRRIQDYHNLGPYLRDLYQLPGVAETCSLDAVKQDYYGNLFPLNPGGIIPCGPDVNLLEPHNREQVSQGVMI
ncbi:glutathione S-transferase family protein [Gloeocapsopsis dulcis]|uniref:Glutathione-dependent reductase n=1 Tax=Gloeocapsopsis dulcis AAB1 = 1H9 TaxID=1433147 RepID=A0A6N8FSW3_9CHRO|nr:glutathione S-transferase family protein [Gloeocapsopsis dulcis]MUL35277.1 glutathione-dependent reductase [Gloeocapsopsis dulcis AAB1 = 1H9]WNN92057.1 glutathione S-transferase family protein [Gloeocapsopsis dulcis]